MEKFFLKAEIVIVVILVAIQGYIFYSEYEKTEYADTGKQMFEETYLYLYDELTVTIEGNTDGIRILKNGEYVDKESQKTYNMIIKENDLIEVENYRTKEPCVIRISLKSGVFDPKYYVDIFDFTGGKVTAGRFVH